MVDMRRTIVPIPERGGGAPVTHAPAASSVIPVTGPAVGPPIRPAPRVVQLLELHWPTENGMAYTLCALIADGSIWMFDMDQRAWVELPGPPTA